MARSPNVPLPAISTVPSGVRLLASTKASAAGLPHAHHQCPLIVGEDERFGLRADTDRAGDLRGRKIDDLDSSLSAHGDEEVSAVGRREHLGRHRTGVQGADQSSGDCVERTDFVPDLIRNKDEIAVVRWPGGRGLWR
jgi:hypothetical protein